jgi:hypothetical protein
MEVPPTAAMTDVIAKMMIEVHLILAIATEEVNLGQSSELIVIKDALKKLDTHTMPVQEARMAIMGNSNVTHIVDNKVTVLIETASTHRRWERCVFVSHPRIPEHAYG